MTGWEAVQHPELYPNRNILGKRSTGTTARNLPGQ